MAYSGPYPLLAQGVNMAGAAATIAGAAISRVQGNVSKGRGNVKMIDCVNNQAPLTSNLALVTLSLGGQILVQDARMTEFTLDGFAGSYQPYLCDVGEGQTFQSTLDNTNGPVAVGGALHFFYENPFDNPEHWKRFTDRALTLKSRTFSASAAAGATTENPQFTVPSQYGDVIGVQLVNDSATRATGLTAFITVKVNGVNIFENVSGALGDPSVARPYLIFPVEIPETSTMQITINNAFGAATNTTALRLYFGKK